DDPNAEQQSSCGRWRLFSIAAVRDLALVDPPHQYGRSPAGDVLFPSVGDRSRPATRQRRQREDTVSPLRESRPYAAENHAPPCRFSVGSRRSRFPRRDSVMDTQTMAESAPRLVGPVTVRSFELHETEQWERFVAAC